MCIHFELVSRRHARALLQFECASRGFFERYIAARPAEFYSEAGVHAHIESMLTLSQQKHGQFYLAFRAGEIVARANLNKIIGGDAEIGYRVSEQAVGHGIGSACVGYLVEAASGLGLQTMSAIVMSNNRASEHVLRKHRFEWVQSQPNAYQHQGKSLHGFVYALSLS